MVEHLPAGLTGSPDVPDMIGLALRRNPRRAHLLVSRVLGKHVPAEPRRILAAGRRLGELVRTRLTDSGPALVIGYAETATALGHGVADALGNAMCLQSTRREVPGRAPATGFAEEHSHATGHLLLPADTGLLTGDGPVVLVDDELTTGNTAANTIRALHRLHPHRAYVVAALLDTGGQPGLTALAAELGVTISVVSVAEARLTLPADALERGQQLASRFVTTVSDPGSWPSPEITRLRLPWPAGLPESARHGFGPDDRARLDRALPALAAVVPPVRDLLVLGTEELMYVPLRLAAELAKSARVRFASTTRSPVVVIDEPGYAIRSALTFPAPEGSGSRYAYNLAGLGVDAVLVVIDPPADTERLDGLLHALGSVSRRVLVATVGV
ncbi:phosphoribosyltransferase family protein [Actinoplanes awajinensis]|uniref:phosphoribosyltransferase family protein n=1 Tax=Actinoplanes awajinensis TaxID=135946 RepID=UPI0018DB0BF5|nr:phosphoribosyltransferase family protein [Actinoplanes awajinensis]